MGLWSSAAYRGHVREAYRRLAGSRWASENTFLLPELALVGVIPHDSAAVTFGRWRRANDPGAAAALGWWATTGDTASIHDLARRGDSLGRVARKASDRDFWRYVAASCRVYRALALHDTTGALAAFAAVPDSLLADYERRRAQNKGAGAARLVGATCQACHLTIPSTEAERIRRAAGSEVAYCDNCGAILVP